MATPTQVLTLAGTGQDTFSEGIVTQASFNWPWKPICLRNGDILMTDRLNNRIRRITVEQKVEVEAGSGEKSGADGLALRAGFNDPSYLFKGENDDIYITEGHGSRLRLLSNGSVTTVAGDGTKGHRDGPALQAQFAIILGGCRVPSGEVYLADNENNRVRVVEKDRMVTSIGTGTAASIDGPKETAAFNQPIGLSVDPTGEVFLSERYRIRHIDKNRRVITFAGTTQGDRDGPKETAQFNNVRDLLFAPSGELFVSDSNNHKIKCIDALGMVSTVSGHKEGWKDGPLLSARFHRPAGLCFNLQGGLLIADCDNARLRIIPDMVHMSSALPTAAIDMKSLLLPEGFLKSHLVSYHHKASDTHFLVHSPFLQLVFPKLLSGGLDKLANSKVSYNTIQNFLTLLYSGTILEVESLDLIEIFYLTQACELPQEFSLAVRKKMFMMMGTLDADAVIRAIFHVQMMCESMADLVDMLVRALKPLFEPSMVPLLTPLVAIDEPFAQKVLMGLYSQPAPPVDVKPLETTTEGYIVNRLEVLYWSTLVDAGLTTAAMSPVQPLLIPLPPELAPDFEIEVGRGGNSMIPQNISTASSPSTTRASAPVSDSSPSILVDSGANVPIRSTDASGNDVGAGLSPRDTGNLANPPHEVIKCHSWLLFGRWPYFRRLVASGFSEVATKSMQIPEETWSLGTVRAFLRYIYTNNAGLFEGSEATLRHELLEYAAMFDLIDLEQNPTPAFAHLIEHCRAPLALNVTVRTSVASYKRLLQYGSPDQRTELIRFMAKNISAIMNDPHLAYDFSQLGPETCSAVLFAIHSKEFPPPLPSRTSTPSKSYAGAVGPASHHKSSSKTSGATDSEKKTAAKKRKTTPASATTTAPTKAPNLHNSNK